MLVERRAFGESLRLVLAALHDLGEQGGVLRELSAATGIHSDLLSVLLRGYVQKGKVARCGRRPSYRYFALPAWADAYEGRPPQEPTAHATSAAELVRRLMRSLGVTLADLMPAAETLAQRQLVTPTARTAKPPKPTKAAKPPKAPKAPKLVAATRRKDAPMREPSKPPLATVLPSASRHAGPVWSRNAEVVVPEGLEVQVCPGGRDRRYEVTADDIARADGLGLGRQWKALTGAAHG